MTRPHAAAVSSRVSQAEGDRIAAMVLALVRAVRQDADRGLPERVNPSPVHAELQRLSRGDAA